VALRAPEVILKIGFDHKLDIWSFGCYLFEVFTGNPLFSLPPFNLVRIDDDHSQQMNGDNGLIQENDDDRFHKMNNDDHLLQMSSTIGQLPSAMFEKWPSRMRYFDADSKLIRTDVGNSDIPLGVINVGDTLEQRFRNSMPSEMTAEEGDDIVQVLRSALQYDPTKRLSATELLSLKWFQDV
jgi:serine/threonine protein kinase